MKFKEIGTIRYPEFINITSIYLGKLRDLYNVELNEKNQKYKRGELSELVNILGVRGELIVQHFLFQNGVNFRFGEILSNKPVVSADIYIGDNIRIDVKTIRDDAPDLLVNESAHDKDKNITHYWFVQPYFHEGKATTIAGYWIFTKEEVDKWDVKDVKYSNAYYKEIKTLIQN